MDGYQDKGTVFHTTSFPTSSPWGAAIGDTCPGLAGVVSPDYMSGIYEHIA
jgi:hypothetical protein